MRSSELHGLLCVPNPRAFLESNNLPTRVTRGRSFCAHWAPKKTPLVSESEPS